MLGGSWNWAKVFINDGSNKSVLIVVLIDGSKWAVMRFRLGNGPGKDSNGFKR